MTNLFDDYLKKRYEPEIKWYDEKSKSHKYLASILQISIITFSALTPVFAALELKILTIIFSSLAAILVGTLKYFKFEELWQNYRTTCETMKKEKVMYEARVNIYEFSKEPEKLFIERLESLISKENTAWIQLVKNKEHNNKKTKF